MENIEVLEGQVTIFELVKNNKYEKLLMLFQYLDDGFKREVEIETEDYIFKVEGFGKVGYSWEENALILKQGAMIEKKSGLFTSMNEIRIPLEIIKCFNL